MGGGGGGGREIHQDKASNRVESLAENPCSVQKQPWQVVHHDCKITVGSACRIVGAWPRPLQQSPPVNANAKRISKPRPQLKPPPDISRKPLRDYHYEKSKPEAKNRNPKLQSSPTRTHILGGGGGSAFLVGVTKRYMWLSRLIVGFMKPHESKGSYGVP